MEHEFTTQIKQILASEFGKEAETVYEASPLIQYLNIKTRSATRGSKARGSFANIYAMYVLVEDYVKQGFHKRKDYAAMIFVSAAPLLSATKSGMVGTAKLT
jgi:hypothetical protein